MWDASLSPPTSYLLARTGADITFLSNNPVADQTRSQDGAQTRFGFLRIGEPRAAALERSGPAVPISRLCIKNSASKSYLTIRPSASRLFFSPVLTAIGLSVGPRIEYLAVASKIKRWQAWDGHSSLLRTFLRRRDDRQGPREPYPTCRTHRTSHRSARQIFGQTTSCSRQDPHQDSLSTIHNRPDLHSAT